MHRLKCSRVRLSAASPRSSFLLACGLSAAIAHAKYLHELKITTAILFHIVMLVALCASCSHEQDVDKVLWLDGISGSDTLFIKGHFDDCGEWGGHSEIIRVFRTREGTMRAKYERDTVNCPDPALFNRRVIERKEADLSEEQQALVVSFTQELVKKSLEGNYFGHAGIAYVVNRPPLESRGLQVVYVTESKWPAFQSLKKSLLSID